VIELPSVRIDKARLESDGGGTIRYVSGEAEAALRSGGKGTELLFAALRDFRYQSLVMEMDGSTTGDLDAVLHISGANPDLYDGYPVELNVNVGGPLMRLLQQGLDTYHPLEHVRREQRQ